MENRMVYLGHAHFPSYVLQQITFDVTNYNLLVVQCSPYTLNMEDTDIIVKQNR